VGDAEALRSMAQAAKDAGDLSSFHMVESYRAIGVTTAPSATPQFRGRGEDCARMGQHILRHRLARFPMESPLEVDCLCQRAVAPHLLLPDPEDGSASRARLRSQALRSPNRLRRQGLTYPAHRRGGIEAYLGPASVQ
jgi:hypothetical protein